MKGFIAVILNMGIFQLGDLKLNTNNLPFFRSVFSRDRFFQIFGALHVGDIEGAPPSVEYPALPQSHLSSI